MAAVEGDELLDYEEETEEVPSADKGDKGSDAKKIKVRSNKEEFLLHKCSTRRATTRRFTAAAFATSC